MNHFIFILPAVLAVVQCGENQVVVPMPADKLSLISDKMAACAAEIKTTTTFQAMLKKKLNREPINEDEFKNSLYCLASKTGIADEHGHAVVDEVLTYFPSNVDKDPIRTTFEDCNNKFSVSDPKEMFMSVFGCYVNASPTLLTFPSD